MVQAWYVDALGEVPNEEQIHFLNSAEVELLTGVECIQVDPSDSVKIARIKKERDVPQEKVVLFSKESFPNFDEQRKFFTEHFHTKEEIRLVLDGSGYFDVRDISDRWIRIKAEAGDLITLPSGTYHRFTLGTNKFIKSKIFDKNEPILTPYYRPSEDLICTKKPKDFDVQINKSA